MSTETKPRAASTPSTFFGETIAVADTAGSLVGDLVRLAAGELERGNIDQAEHYLQQGLSRDPDDYRCRAYLAVCQAVQNPRSREPEQVARDIMAAHPDDPVGYLALGQVYLQRSRRRDAFRLFAEARELAARERTLRRQLERVEPRKAPVFPALSRNHFLNIYGGRIRAYFARLRRG